MEKIYADVLSREMSDFKTHILGELQSLRVLISNLNGGFKQFVGAVQKRDDSIKLLFERVLELEGYFESGGDCEENPIVISDVDESDDESNVETITVKPSMKRKFEE